jgi:tol-pal system protein YbgF
MNNWCKVVTTLVAGTAFAGCAADDVMVKRQTEMESRIESLLQSNKAINVQLADLSGELLMLKGQVRAGGEDIDRLEEGQKELRESLNAMHTRNLAAETASPAAKVEVVNRAVAGDRDGGSQEAYMKAYGLYSANKYDQAVEAFTAFLQAYPASEFTANAQYWIGECHYTQSSLPPALEAFQKVIANYPAAQKVPDAMLKAAYTLYAMHHEEKGRAMLENLIEKYPKSPAADKARERLSRR